MTSAGNTVDTICNTISVFSAAARILNINNDQNDIEQIVPLHLLNDKFDEIAPPCIIKLVETYNGTPKYMKG